MIIFKAKNCDPEWAPRIETNCPYCGHSMGFYSTIHCNQCKRCKEFMPTTPNIAAIAKKQEARIIHHVIDADKQ